MADSDSQINFKVDEDAKELAKQRLEYGELSKTLRETVEEIAFGEELSKRSKIESRLDAINDRLDELHSEREKINAEIEEKESKKERLDERLSELDSREDEYSAALEMLEDQLMDGTHLDPGHAQIKKAAHIGEKDPEDVIDDLKERNPSVPDYAFVQYREAKRQGNTWTGVA